MPKIFHDVVTVADLTFNTDTPDDSGVIWHLDGLVGWDDEVEATEVVSAMAYSDGVITGSRFPVNRRFVEVEGVCVCPDRLSAQRAFNRIKTVFGPNDRRRITRFSPIPEALDVRRAAKVTKILDTGKIFRWSTTVFAPWPYKVSPSVKSGVAQPFAGREFSRVYDQSGFVRLYDTDNARGFTTDTDPSLSNLPTEIAMVNEGNADAYPLIEIRGPLPRNSWTLQNEATGQEMEFDIDLSGGATLRLDSLAQTATVNGASVDQYVRGEWPRLAPGANLIRLVVGRQMPGAQMTVFASDTWR